MLPPHDLWSARQEGKTWTLASPLNGPPVDHNVWGQPGYKISAGPFGVEPKLAMQDSGVLFLSTGRPRICRIVMLSGCVRCPSR